MKTTQNEISSLCDEIKSMLLDKNLKYGDSAINPVRFLSKSSPIEQILVRIDDKLNRIKQGSVHIQEDEDVINDLIGYFVLLKIAIKRDKEIGFDAVNMNQFLTDYIDNQDVLPYTKSSSINNISFTE